MQAKILFLGTGGSLGIPIITCNCSVCSSQSQFNKRLRPSVLISIEDKRFVIDIGPDFRAQALRFGIDSLNGALLTHTHYDHIGGIDDLRVFYLWQKKNFPILLSRETYAELKHRFYYLFESSPNPSHPHFEPHLLEKDFGVVVFQGVSLNYMSYYQAGMKVTGFRFGELAYISDIRHYDHNLVEALQGVEILILSALRYTPSEVHFNIDEAIDFCRAIGAKKTFFTHIAHDLEHDETNYKLPSNVRLAHDGLEFSFDLEVL